MIYLDNAATSFPKPPGVADSVNRFLLKVGANTGRSSHKAAIEADRIIFNCREQIAELLGVADSSRIVFTSNATEALNLAIFGIVNPGNTILTSTVEHNSVMRPLRYLEKEKKIDIIQFKTDRFGFPDMDDFRMKLAAKPDFAVFSAASNITGVVTPFEEMSLLAAEKGIPVCVDGAQVSGSYPVNMRETGIDLFAFSGHKGLLGPTGTGGLYIGDKVNPRPLVFGGTGSRSSEESQPDFMPDKYESGTLNIAGIAGLKAAVEFILDTGIEKIRKRKKSLTDRIIDGVKDMKELELHLPANCSAHTPVLSFTHKTKSVAEIAATLDKNNIAARMGLHCAPAAHKTLGTFDKGGTVRLSPGFFNSEEDIENTLKVMYLLKKDRPNTTA